MSDLIVFTVGSRNPDGGYAEFMASPDEKAIDEYVDIMQNTVDDDWEIIDRKSTRLNSSHPSRSRMPSSA